MPENATTNENNHVTLILRELSDDEKMKYITEMREKALHDEATAMNAAEKKRRKKRNGESKSRRSSRRSRRRQKGKKSRNSRKNA